MILTLTHDSGSDWTRLSTLASIACDRFQVDVLDAIADISCDDDETARIALEEETKRLARIARWGYDYALTPSPSEWAHGA